VIHGTTTQPPRARQLSKEGRVLNVGSLGSSIFTIGLSDKTQPGSGKVLTLNLNSRTKGAALDRDVINPPEMPALNPTYSQAIRSNGFIFVAGQIGIDPATGKLVSDDIAKQAQQAIENSALILRAAGSSLEKVVSATLYLTEFDELSRVNEVYGRYFPKNGPAKTSCGVSKLYQGARVEIQFIALV
jgi:2-iminobutanoate/2-iminopropanoate deaminase